MAEQDSHNVVIQPESTSDSASLVDASSNHNSTLNALAGLENSKIQISNSDHVYTTEKHELSNNVDDKAGTGPRAGNVTTESLESLKSMRERENNTPDEGQFDISAEASDNDKEHKDAQHNRTNSVKRPATFSKVSISKNFLAKTATATPLVTKAGEKNVATVMTTPAALKPRLVAKSATLTNALKTRNGADNSPGPDASTVWNKNRPAPAMPTKQFTDEELKQQYGIHLATRLQTDEAGKGSKWADIDDDEDDWAPEAVVWMDGTKSSLTPAESTAVQQPILAKPTETKPTLTVLKKLGDSGTIKTILKPGAAVQAKQQISQNGLPSPSEKQVKNAAPVPAKSPWAPLPPIEKISPVNPPVQQLQPTSSFVSQDVRVSQDARVLEGGPQAREIAADTFDRSWREGEGERRELFNSNSGRYEPAPEARRNSVKDPYGRKPVINNRVSQEHPARVHGDVSNFANRRGSSVSHASGPTARRMSYSKGSESVVSDQPDGRQVIGQQTPWSQQLPPPPANEVDEAEDPVKIQERVMREKREAARLRRQEEEVKEEAAKQERLKAKLDALANAGQSRKERQAAVEVLHEEPVKAEIEEEVVSKPVITEPAIEIPTEASPQVPEHISPSTASRTTFQSQASGSYRTTQTSAFSSPGDRKLQPFGRNPNDAFTPWPSSVASSNVWGVSGIGNGTFEGSSLFAPISQPLGSLPPPPGMGRPSTSTRISPQNLGQPTHSPQMQEAQFAIGQRVQPRQHVPGPIGPPSRTQQPAASVWQAAAQSLPAQYNRDPEASEIRHAPLPTEQKRADVFKETFRQTGIQNRLGGPRSFEKTEYTVHDAQGSRTVNPIPPNAQSQPVEPKQSEESAVRLPDGSTNPAHGGTAVFVPVAAPIFESQPRHIADRPRFTTTPLPPAIAISTATPPPPETNEHPVYAGANRANVRLPPPPPVVRLPPMHMPSMTRIQYGVAGNQPIVKNGEWQARFNGLFNRTPIQTEVPPSPPRTPPKAFAPILAVASSSRLLMDDAEYNAVVSLPRAAEVDPFVVDGSDAVTSKDMVQHMFKEELGFGSRPNVRIPRYAYITQPHSNKLEERSENVDVQTKPDLPVFHLFYKKPGGYYIKVPGSTKNRFASEEYKKPFAGKVNKVRTKKDLLSPPTSARKSSTLKTSENTPQKPNPVQRKRSGHQKHGGKPTAPTAPA